MTAKDYAAAVSTLSKEGASGEEIASGLVSVLGARGETKLLPSILATLKRGLAREESLAPRVEVAHAADERAALRAAAALGITASSASVNPLLISGWRAFGAGMLVDRSGKSALVGLYRAATR